MPSALHRLPAGESADRVGLAKWLVDRGNPLTARVTVNRLWARFFGRGIVETEEDFGTQGSLPTHPEVLDDLAVDFMERDWDVKRTMAEIVTSATYRQSSMARRATSRRIRRIGCCRAIRVNGWMRRRCAIRRCRWRVS